MILIHTVSSERLLMDVQNHSNKVRKTDSITFALRHTGVSFSKQQTFNQAIIEINNHVKDLRLSHRALVYHDSFTQAVYRNSLDNLPLLSDYRNPISTIGSDLHLFISD